MCLNNIGGDLSLIFKIIGDDAVSTIKEGLITTNINGRCLPVSPNLVPVIVHRIQISIATRPVHFWIRILGEAVWIEIFQFFTEGHRNLRIYTLIYMRL